MNSFVTKKSYEVYVAHIALQRHFTTKSYDYMKYNGKVRVSVKSFEKRKDGYFYHKLSQRSDWFDFLLAQVIDDPKKWIGNIVNYTETESVYTNFIKIIESLTYTVKQDLAKLEWDFDANLKVVLGEHPRLLELYETHEISLETLTILSDLMDFFPYWDANITDTIHWPKIRMKCEKYRPFLRKAYDPIKMKEVVINQFSPV